MTPEEFEVCYLNVLGQVLNHIRAVSVLATQVANKPPQTRDSTQSLSREVEYRCDPARLP
jgi:hypothetical protein